MLRASLLTMAISSSCFAFLGDWNVWTPSTDARMAVISDGTAWVATSGGVMEWDLKAGASRMHTRKTGLPTIDIGSIVLDSSHTVWAIGTDGRIGYRTTGSSEWQTVESYSSQNWTFPKRAAQFWKGPNHPGFLILGTDHGLSLFSLKTMAAEDFTSAFGKISGAVRAVMVTPGSQKSSGVTNPDTLWVALDGGLAHATPNWDSVGTAGHYLADPSQWVVDTVVSQDSTNTLVRGQNGTRLANKYLEWSNSTGSLSIYYGTVKWKTNNVIVDGSSHVIEYGSDVLVSSGTKGAVLVSASGSLQTTTPEGNYPDIPPPSLRIANDGSLVSLTGIRGNHVVTYSSTSHNWSSDTIRFIQGSETILGQWDINETNNNNRVGLAIDPQGQVIVPTWAESPFMGGIFTSTATKGIWNHHNYTESDTCVSLPIADLGPSYSGALTAARSNSNGTWLTARSHTYRGRVLFLAPGGQTAPTCLDIPAENMGVTQIYLNDVLQIGDTLWFASKTSLIKLASPRPAYPPPIVSNAVFIRPSFSSELNLYRLVKVEFEGKTWIVGAASGRLTLFPADGSLAGKPVSTLFTSDSSAPSLNQSYRTLVVDAQGQIWAGGEKGIDIVQLVPPDADSLPPTFQPIRRITTADGLPQNYVVDMDLQVSTGKALIATPSAVALWTSPYRPIAARLAKSSVRVSPNPVRLRRAGEPDKYLYVDGATADSRFDLLSADGTLVMHLDASKMVGGQFQIPLPAPSKLRPGLYFWSLKDKNGSVRGPLLIAE